MLTGQEKGEIRSRTELAVSRGITELLQKKRLLNRAEQLDLTEEYLKTAIQQCELLQMDCRQERKIREEASAALTEDKKQAFRALEKYEQAPPWLRNAITFLLEAADAETRQSTLYLLKAETGSLAHIASLYEDRLSEADKDLLTGIMDRMARDDLSPSSAPTEGAFPRGKAEQEQKDAAPVTRTPGRRSQKAGT